MRTLLIIVAAYFVADLFAGVYHMLTDKGWNIKQQVVAFQQHHNGLVVFDLKPVFFALPIIAIGLYFHLLFVVSFACFAGCTELCHYAAHKPERCCFLVHWLQRSGLILAPVSHAKHHNGLHDKSFCVMSGKTNWFVDWVSNYVPERKECRWKSL